MMQNLRLNMKKDSWIRNVISPILLSGFALYFFIRLLSSWSEIVYMTVPIAGLLFLVFRHPAAIRPAFTKKNLARVLFYVLVLIGVFWRLSYMMNGRIIWTEVFLAGYFMIAIGIILSLLQRFLKKLARRLSKFAQEGQQPYVYMAVYACFWTFIILPYILAVFSVHRPKIGDRENPKDLLGLDYETVRFETQDRLQLEGWFVPQPKAQQTVIIGHGLGANKSNFISLVRLWHSWGYHVFIFDFRGHGHSQGHTLSFGYKESRDIQAAVDYLLTREEVDPHRIVGYGVSFGGAAMIQAAGQDSRIKWVIVDSTFADFKTMAQKVVAQLRFVPKILYQSLSHIGLIWASVEAECPLTQYSPKDRIQQLKNQPVLIIHGKHDRLIPVEEAYHLHQSAPEPKELYVIDAAGHYATLADQDYEARVLEFLARYKNRSQ